MQADFNLSREEKNELEYSRVHSPSYYLHFHSHIEIYVILSGEVEVIINGRRKLLRGGEISVAMSYDAHGYNTPKAADAEYLIIPISYCADILPPLENRRSVSSFIDDPKTFKTVCDAMEHILSNPNEISMRGYIYIILGAILDCMSNPESPHSNDAHIEPDILIYLSKSFREELSVKSLAEHFGYNPSYFSRSFHNTFGISFGKYLTLLRLREAIMLMKKGDKNITECAFESGFGSIRSFYRAFSDEFKCSPKEYLKRI
jgi:AraC-like DNA-binding protein